MPIHRLKRLALAAAAALTVASFSAAFAQVGPGGTPSKGGKQTGGASSDGGGARGGGGIGGAMLGIVGTIPRDSVAAPDKRPRERAKPASRSTPPAQSAARRGPSGVPPAGETRFMPDEVLVEVADGASPATLDAIERRARLTRLETQSFQLTGSAFMRLRIPDGRPVAAVIRQLEADNTVISAQPNYLYALQQGAVRASGQGDPAQYELAKVQLLPAHQIATGDNVLVAVVDSGVDPLHPELSGSIAGTFDTVEFLPGLNKHGTAISGLIAAHRTLLGAAPAARILSVRVFGPTGNGASWNILKGLDWAVSSGARIINMSFAGPSDPATGRFMAAAYAKGIVLIAAAGNAGPKSPPLYPAADPNVIAVSATDAKDQIFDKSNRGSHIAIASPGVELMVAIPGGAFEMGSGTSYSAATVTGVAALLLQQKPDLSPAQVRAILMATAKDLGPKGQDSLFGAGLINAYDALKAPEPAVATAPPVVERVSAGKR
jgi:subtilisin family serine protease